MSWLDGLGYRVRSFFRRSRVDAEREAEIGFHLSLDEEQQRHDGLTPSAARLASRKRFGSPAYYREEVRQVGVSAALDGLGRDLKQAVRSLSRSPAFSAAAVLTLALGIGALAGIGTVTWSVLLEPLPYPNPSRLVAIWLRYPTMGAEMRAQSDAAYFTLRRLNRSLESLAAYRTHDVNLGDATNPERATGAMASADFFTTLQARPLEGRLIAAADDRPGAAPVVVLGEGLWRRRFGADPGVLGRSIPIDGRSHQVIGILPAAVAHPEGADLWTALQPDPDHALPSRATFDLIGRLKPGVTIEGATTDLQAAHDRMPDFFPDAGFGVSTRNWLERGRQQLLLHPLRDDVVGDIGDVLWVLVATAAFVLLIAGANVATLFLVRSDAKQREVAVRAALGAGTRRLRRAVLTESLVLAAAGGGLGCGLAWVGIRLLGHAAGASIPRFTAIGLDGVVVGGIVALTVLVGVGLSLLPIRRIGGLAVASVLRSGGRGTTGGRERQRVRQILVAAQVSLAFALLAGSGLLARSYRELRHVRPGFDPAGVLTARVALPRAAYRTTADVSRFYLEAMDRLRSLPGVTSVGGASRAPLGPGEDDGNPVIVEGRAESDLVHVNGHLVYIAGDHFRALGMPLIAGRSFGRLDPDRVAQRSRGDPELRERAVERPHRECRAGPPPQAHLLRPLAHHRRRRRRRPPQLLGVATGADPLPPHYGELDRRLDPVGIDPADRRHHGPSAAHLSDPDEREPVRLRPGRFGPPFVTSTPPCPSSTWRRSATSSPPRWPGPRSPAGCSAPPRRSHCCWA